MFLLILSWTFLVLIAVTDARENRIPNSLVVSLLIIGLGYQWESSGSLGGTLMCLSCGVVVFLSALILHLFKLMAPGDVKLMAAVGCLVGWSGLGSTIIWISVSTVIVGLFYIALFRAQRVAGSTSVQSDCNQRYASKTLSNEKMLMPFAPIVVIGLALSNYFN